MQVAELFSRDAAGYRQASQSDASELLEAFRRCYAPHPVSDGALRSNLDRYKSWTICSGESSVTVGEWFEQLSAPMLSNDFKSRLAIISSANRRSEHRAALEPFQLGRFCEFRAALIAMKSGHFESALVSPPNSRADSLKKDLTLQLKGGSDLMPLQVKAVDGTKRKSADSTSLPVLRRVWVTPLKELQSEIERLVAERGHKVSTQIDLPLEY